MLGSQVRPAVSGAQDTVGTLLLALARLQAALAPAPQRLLAELHKRLPALAAVRYERLSESIHSAAAWLRQRPASTEEAVERLTFLVELQVALRARQWVLHFSHAPPVQVLFPLNLNQRSTQDNMRYLCLLKAWAKHRGFHCVLANERDAHRATYTYIISL